MSSLHRSLGRVLVDDSIYLLNAVCPVVTGVMSAATSPSAARFALAYVTKFVTHAC